MTENSSLGGSPCRVWRARTPCDEVDARCGVALRRVTQRWSAQIIKYRYLPVLGTELLGGTLAQTLGAGAGRSTPMHVAPPNRRRTDINARGCPIALLGFTYQVRKFIIIVLCSLRRGRTYLPTQHSRIWASTTAYVHKTLERLRTCI